MSYPITQQLAQQPLNLLGDRHRQVDSLVMAVGLGYSSFSDRISSTGFPILINGMFDSFDSTSTGLVKKPALVRGQSGRYRFRTTVPI